jgi:hypothetical protein
MKKIVETERLTLREMDVVADAAFVLELLNEPAFIRYVADRGVRDDRRRFRLHQRKDPAELREIRLRVLRR